MFNVHRLCDLNAAALEELRGLTNSAARGDNRDNAPGAGSAFRLAIDDHLTGAVPFTRNSWAIVASNWLWPVAWSMLRRIDVDPDTHVALQVPTGVLGLYVHPRYRRKGLGEELVRRTQDVARKNGMGRMLVNPWNKSSAAFFSRCGFTEVSPYATGWCVGVAALDLQ